MTEKVPDPGLPLRQRVLSIVDGRVTSEVCPKFFQLGGEGVIEHELTAAGFDRVRVERLATTLAFSGADDICAAMFEGSPVALAYARFDGLPGARRRRISSRPSWCTVRRTVYEIPAEFVVATGVRPADA